MVSLFYLYIVVELELKLFYEIHSEKNGMDR